MLKPRKNCQVCQAIKQSKRLQQAIYNSTYFMKGSDTSLTMIWEDYGQVAGRQFSYTALLNHVKKHQFMSEDDYTSRHLRNIAQQAEKQILKRNIEAKSFQQRIIDDVDTLVAEGKLTPTIKDALTAARDKTAADLKQRDQQMAWADMVFHFSSGENDNKDRRAYDKRVVEGTAVTNIDTADKITGGAGAGENRPSDIYYGTAWDAPAQGTS